MPIDESVVSRRVDEAVSPPLADCAESTPRQRTLRSPCLCFESVVSAPLAAGLAVVVVADPSGNKSSGRRAKSTPRVGAPRRVSMPAVVSQKLELRRAKERLRLDGRRWSAFLGRFGVATAHRLSYDQANRLIGLLRSRASVEETTGARRISYHGGETRKRCQPSDE